MDSGNNRVARKNLHNKSWRLNSSKVAKAIVLLDMIISINKILLPEIRRKIIIIINNRVVFKDINEKWDGSG